MCQSISPSYSLPYPFGNHKFVSYVYDYFSSVNKFICTIF